MKRKSSYLWWVALGFAGVAFWLFTKRASSYSRLRSDLRSPLLRFRSPAFTPALVSLMQRAPARFTLPTNVHVEAQQVPGPPDQPDVPVFVYRPFDLRREAPALVYIHGGGYIVGSAGASHAVCARYARELGILVVSVDYRLAPSTPFPGALEDCYAALLWTKRRAADLGIDAERIAVAGESAGAGLAAALAQVAHDRGEVKLAFQSLTYPMLDDRTVLRRDHEGRGEFVWKPASNRLGWTSYLGRQPNLESAPEYAVPARRTDLTGLPPASDRCRYARLVLSRR